MTRKPSFGTDGIRGVGGQPPLDRPTAAALGRVLVRAVFEAVGDPGLQRPRVVVARDTRLSGPLLRDGLVAGVAAEGGVAVDVGILPTPGLSALLDRGWGEWGVMITASHNPAADNGLKVLRGDGRKPSPQEQSRLEAALHRVLAASGAPVTTRSSPEPETPAVEVYLDAVLACLPPGSWLAGRHVVLDAAHGAGFQTLPALLERLGARVTRTGCTPDGARINDDCGVLHPGRLVERVRAVGADAGIALDGDGDRGLVVGGRGRVLTGDEMIFLLARPPAVVGTVMTGGGLEAALAAQGIGLLRTDVGDRFVDAAVREHGLLVGGEPSGHVCLADGLPTADGALAALRVLAGGFHLEERLATCETWPQSLESIRVAHRVDLDTDPDVARIRAEAVLHLGPQGRVLLRYSGTEPVLRIFVEARDPAAVQAVGAELRGSLIHLLGS